MTLLLPSSRNVKLFIGEVWNEEFAEKAALFQYSKKILQFFCISFEDLLMIHTRNHFDF